MTTHVVTGVAGFIGSHLTARLLADGHDVVGVDLVGEGAGGAALAEARLARFADDPGFRLHRADIADEVALGRVADLLDGAPATIVHLAAKAGVRASVDDPRGFVRTNVTGFTNVAELARDLGVAHLVYASSSSVYGGLEKVPFTPHDPVGHPVSVYAATKRADELLAHAYAHLHGLPSTGLRFFTVYGPWGRPDMAYWIFAQAILASQPIEVYGDGSAVRDLTYVDDVVDAIVPLLDRPPTADPLWAAADPDPGSAAAPFAVHNVGHGGQVSVTGVIEVLADALGATAEVRHLPPRRGDVPRTWADTSTLEAVVGSTPTTGLADGIERFAAWFRPWFAEHGPIT